MYVNACMLHTGPFAVLLTLQAQGFDLGSPIFFCSSALPLPKYGSLSKHDLSQGFGNG